MITLKLLFPRILLKIFTYKTKQMRNDKRHPYSPSPFYMFRHVRTILRELIHQIHNLLKYNRLC